MTTTTTQGRRGLRIDDATVRVVNTIEQLCGVLALPQQGRILETDLDIVETECDHHQRRRRDAEVLCTLAANCKGDALELGTSHGRGTFKLATNLPNGVVHTVNVLPEQAAGAGALVTHLLPEGEIGAFYRAHGVRNVNQIFANLRHWQPAPALHDLGLAFVDACHDADAVRADSHLAWRCLAAGGYLLGHDWSPFVRARFDWIDQVMLGASAFLREVGVSGPVVHLRHSWVGVVRKPQ